MAQHAPHVLERISPQFLSQFCREVFKCIVCQLNGLLVQLRVNLRQLVLKAARLYLAFLDPPLERPGQPESGNRVDKIVDLSV